MKSPLPRWVWAGAYACPKCGRKFAPALGALQRGEINGIKPKNKKVELTLLMHPRWLDGSPAKNAQGKFSLRGQCYR